MRRLVSLTTDDNAAPLTALLFLASDDRSRNRNWLGPACEDDIAKQVSISRGPSGLNLEYALRLAEAIRDMGKDDSILFSLEKRLRALNPGEEALERPPAECSE